MRHDKEIISRLISNGVITPEKEELAVKIMDDYWRYKVVSVWYYGDVLQCATNNDMEISEQTAKDIIEEIDGANVNGVSFEMIDEYLSESQYQEESSVLMAEEDDLPLMIGELKTVEGKQALEKRLKGFKNDK